MFHTSLLKHLLESTNQTPILSTDTVKTGTTRNAFVTNIYYKKKSVHHYSFYDLHLRIDCMQQNGDDFWIFSCQISQQVSSCFRTTISRQGAKESNLKRVNILLLL